MRGLRGLFAHHSKNVLRQKLRIALKVAQNFGQFLKAKCRCPLAPYALDALTPDERAARNVPSRLLTTDQISKIVVRLAEDRSLAGRVVVWWSEDEPLIVDWGDRGYRGAAGFSLRD